MYEFNQAAFKSQTGDIDFRCESETSIEAPLESEFKRHAREHANLEAYCERMKALYYSAITPMRT